MTGNKGLNALLITAVSLGLLFHADHYEKHVYTFSRKSRKPNKEFLVV